MAAALIRFLRIAKASALLAATACAHAASSASVPHDVDDTTVCSGRHGCRVVEWREAGVDAAGSRVRVARLTVQSDDPSCVHEEIWSVVERDAAAPRLQRLTSRCVAEAVGDDVETLAVSTNGATLLRTSEGRAHAHVALEVRLSPAQHIRASFGTVSRHDPEASDDASFIYSEFRGTQTSTRMLCSTEAEISGCDPASPSNTCRIVRSLVPWVEAMPEELGAGAWRTTALGQCALHVSSDGAPGTALAGAPSARDDARFAVVLSDDAIYVDLRDDHFVRPAVGEEGDTLTFHWVTGFPEDVDTCVPSDAATESTVVGAVDGRILDGRPITLELVRVSSDGVRMRIAREPGMDFALAYSDRDHGDAVERVIATSPLGSRATSFPQHPFLVTADVASCVVDAGELDVRAALPRAEQALFAPQF